MVLVVDYLFQELWIAKSRLMFSWVFYNYDLKKLGVQLHIRFHHNMSFYRSKKILDRPNNFVRVQIILDRFKRDWLDILRLVLNDLDPSKNDL